MGKGQKPDVIVVGAGVFGLSIALACARRGHSVRVLEAGDRPGFGSSGGVLGALSPYGPDRQSEQAAFQFEALCAAEAFWGDLARLGGVDAGYARLGRLLPLATPQARALAETRAVAAAERWGGAADWRLVAPDHAPDWLAPEAAPEGAVFETLSARLAPRRAIAALAAALRSVGGDIRTRAPVTAAEPGSVRLGGAAAGERLRARAVVLAAGADLPSLVPGLPVTAVKGQAARVAVAAPEGAVMLYSDGIYAVPQGDGTVAVGSTNETVWEDRAATDGWLEAVLARARSMCPLLATGEIVERWAGLRPRGARPDPMLGALPGAEGVFVAGGGFKIGFALAPAIGPIVADMIEGAEVALPHGFALGDHLAGGIRP